MIVFLLLMAFRRNEWSCGWLVELLLLGHGGCEMLTTLFWAAYATWATMTIHGRLEVCAARLSVLPGPMRVMSGSDRAAASL